MLNRLSTLLASTEATRAMSTARMGLLSRDGIFGNGARGQLAMLVAGPAAGAAVVVVAVVGRVFVSSDERTDDRCVERGSVRASVREGGRR